MGYQPGFSPPNSTSYTISSPPNSTNYTISADQVSSGSTSSTYYNPQTPNVVQYGWACPRCGKVNAPWANQCTCHRETSTVWGSTTTNNPNINIKSGSIAIDKDYISTYTIHNGEIKA